MEVNKFLTKEQLIQLEEYRKNQENIHERIDNLSKKDIKTLIEKIKESYDLK